MSGGWENQVVAVTGAAGFLGSHLCEALVAEGALVCALDNFEAGTETNLERVRDELRVIPFDITRAGSNGPLAEADVVFHLAAIANPRLCQEQFPRAYQVNVEGTRRVLESCRPGARFVFLSGAMAYGEPQALPIPETHPLGARDPYSLTKIMGECLVWALASTRRLGATVVRNFSTYGPRQSADYVIPRMITQGLTQGRIELWTTKPTRDFTYIDDSTRALLAIAASQELIGEAVNLGSGAEISIGELAARVARLLGGLPVHDLARAVVGSQRQCADNAKLRRATGWQPRVSLEEGLAQTIDWLRAGSARAPVHSQQSVISKGGTIG
jgi:nucleoside-diphosphate-sugar epimerase